MRKCIAFICLILVTDFSFCQNLRQQDPVKTYTVFSVGAGVSYKTFLGNRYIEPGTYNSFTGKTDIYDLFTRIPTFGFYCGGLFDINHKKHFIFSIGLQYSFSKEIFKGNNDTVLKYGTSNSIHYINKYNYTFHDLVIPISFSYRFNKLILSIGADIAFITLRSTTYGYIPQNSHYYPDISNELGKKSVKDFKILRTIYPNIQLSYSAKIKSVILVPYLKFEYGIKDNLILQLGCNFPLCKI